MVLPIASFTACSQDAATVKDYEGGRRTLIANRRSNGGNRRHGNYHKPLISFAR